MTMRHVAVVFGLALSMMALCGCDSGPGVHPVTGRVTYKGQPLAGGGSIAFIPVNNPAAKSAGGTIAADGTYRLTTNRENDGCMVGEFRVAIIQSTVTEPEAAPDGSAPVTKSTEVSKDQQIPPIYADLYQSPLTATIEPGRNEKDFTLPQS